MGEKVEHLRSNNKGNLNNYKWSEKISVSWVGEYMDGLKAVLRIAYGNLKVALLSF